MEAKIANDPIILNIVVDQCNILIDILNENGSEEAIAQIPAIKEKRDSALKKLGEATHAKHLSRKRL